MTLKLIGFWEETDTPPEKREWPHPRLFVDPNWQTANKKRIVNYLKSGVYVTSELGYATDRFDGKTKKELGSSDLSDGVWIWPEGLWIYVERYNVRLPDEFVAQMEANDFEVPKGLDGEALAELMPTFDPEPWRRWCREEIAKQKISQEASL